MRAWRNVRGELNKERILEIIENAMLTFKPKLQQADFKPLRQRDIIRKSGLSRSTASKWLTKLTEENKVKKDSDGGYIVIRDHKGFVDSRMFKHVLELSLEYAMNKQNPAGGILSPFRLGKLNAKSLVQKNIFEFANVVGAFFTYILIESYCPELNDTMAQRVLGYDTTEEPLFFYHLEHGFNHYFNTKHNKNHGLLFEEDIKDKKGWEENRITQSEFDNVSEAFQKVYPTIYSDITQMWKDFCEIYIKSQHNRDGKYRRCQHEWNEQNMARFGIYHECNICGSTRMNKSPKRKKVV